MTHASRRLDQSPISDDSSPESALAETVASEGHAERLGDRRFRLAAALDAQLKSDNYEKSPARWGLVPAVVEVTRTNPSGLPKS